MNYERMILSDYIIKEQYLLKGDAHKDVRFILEDIYRSGYTRIFLELFAGRGFCMEDIWSIGYSHGAEKRLSEYSKIKFIVKQFSNSDDPKMRYETNEYTTSLNMEELYYYLELSYYFLIEEEKENPESFSWYLAKLSHFRTQCAIKDIYAERLERFREFYSVEWDNLLPINVNDHYDETHYLINNFPLLNKNRHSAILPVFEHFYSQRKHDYYLLDLLAGLSTSFCMGGQSFGSFSFKHGENKDLSKTSIVEFCCSHRQQQIDENISTLDKVTATFSNLIALCDGRYSAQDIVAKLDMEELYYYLELNYYIMLEEGYENLKSIGWYHQRLEQFRQKCEIKDIYQIRLQLLRDEYGIRFNA